MVQSMYSLTIIQLYHYYNRWMC